MAEPEAVQRARVQLGRQFAAYRKAAGYSQEQLARLVLVSRSTIANVETGRQRVPRTFWERCDAVLSIGGRLTFGYEELSRLDRQLGIEAAARMSPGGSVQPAPRPRKAEALVADGVLSSASLIMALAADHSPGLQHRGPAGSVVLGEDASFRVSAELLLKQTLKLDEEQGGDTLYLPLSQLLAQMSEVVDEDPDENLGAFGQLSQLTGWLALDANRHGSARRYLSAAIYAAHEADEPSLRLSQQGNVAWGERHAHNGHNGRSW